MNLGTHLRLGTVGSEVPSLALDFVSAPILSSAVTFSRGSAATTVGQDGLIQTVAVNAPRFDFDPATLAPRGLLIEEARTNLLTYSDQFDNAAWTKSRTTITANATTAPDGTSSADKLVEDTTAAASHRTFRGLSKAASSLTRTFSVYVKASERTLGRIQVSDNTESVQCFATFDLTAGTISAASITGGATISAASSSITNAGNGWYRCIITATFDATITFPGAFIFLRDGAGSVNYTGDGVSGFFIFGAQWEDGAFATSYIPTAASQVTRSADVATMTGGNFSAWYNASEGTVVANFATTQASASLSGIASISDGTSSNEIFGYYNTTAALAQVAVAGATQASLSNAAVLANNAYRFAFAYKLNDFASSISGRSVVTDTSGTLPTVNRLTIGARGGNNNQLNGHIRTLAYYRTRLPNPTLQRLSA